ncbi:HAD family hydrolase [archaeon]|jgi:FMN phosphatase YigB (HAD superfamily)|nr:HAD family hydrolase [archaeon]MBT4417501.1 HAD family hydrolase [archaeon]
MIKVIGFDLDQTLYPKSYHIDEAIQLYIYEKISEFKKCSLEEAKELFCSYYPELSGSKALMKLGVPDARNIIQEALERADIDKYLEPNEELKKLLLKLKDKYIVDLITGSNKGIALKKLARLDIPIELFNVAITGEIAKSDGTAYREWLKNYGYDASEFLYIGDRKSTDVDVPKELGINSFLVNVTKFDENLEIKQFKSILDIGEVLL